MPKTDTVDRPSKRSELLSDESESDDSGTGLNGTSKDNVSNGFAINEEYARRFDHNKKREELHRLEEKYKSAGVNKRKRPGDDISDEDEDEDESTSEEEDDDGELATEALDQEIFATLKAIKEKDPRVYDGNVKFYKEFDPDAEDSKSAKSNEKPMFLQDYHRQNLMEGYTGENAENRPFPTYQEEQDKLKRELVGAMHASKPESDSDEDVDGELLVAKSKPQHRVLPASRAAQITDTDVKAADRDPQTYLSNFMAARAWMPGESSTWQQPFASDDSDEDARADEFEEAYNMRFENPAMANEKLQSFARDVGKYGVRREEKTNRQLAREKERQIKDARRQERDEERARLRKLKVEEAEEKVRRIKDVAGIRGQVFDLDKWRDMIEGDFDDAKWEKEMMDRFGDDYYAQHEGNDEGSDGDDEKHRGKKQKTKKPKWDDDIDIQDLVPDFDPKNADVQLTEDEDNESGSFMSDGDTSDAHTVQKKNKTKKDRAKDKAEAKREARKERAQLEEMIDASIPLSHPELAPSASSSKAPAVGFRYRETSPTSFGLSARDILFAEDAQLNQFAGLKKLAAFRDEAKKRKDKKALSKKARLRQWRKDTFGNPDEPDGGFERLFGDDAKSKDASKANQKDGHKKKRKGKKKQKTVTKA